MMKRLLIATLLAAGASSVYAQPQRAQSGYDTGPVVNCFGIDGSPSRCVMPGVVPYDTTGSPLGTAANPLYTSGGGGGGGSADVQGTGTLALGTVGSTYVIPLTGGRGIVGLTITGLTGSGATIVAEGSNDGGTTWTNANTTESSTTSSLSSTITANGQPRVQASGRTQVRLRVTVAGTGTATIAYNTTTSTGGVFLTSTLPWVTSATGVIGGVDNKQINGNTISTATGVTDIGTQRISIATDDLVATRLGTIAGTVAATGSPAATAQTIQANALPLPTGAATEARQATANATIGTPGSAAPTTGQLVGGSDGTSFRALSTTTGGQVNVAYGSGTFTVGGATATNAARSGNPVYTGCLAANSAPTAVTTSTGQNNWCTLAGATVVSPASAISAATDTVSNSLRLSADPGGTPVSSLIYPYVFNGTSWDRQRDVSSLTGTTGTGLLGAGVLGWDGSAYRRQSTDSTGVLDSPRSSSASRVVTRTALTANTSTTICPAQANIVAMTVFIPSSGTGIGWAGQALTTATPGTANTTPEFTTSAANATWNPTVPPTNLVTAYGSAQTIVCVQDVKQ